LTNRGLGLHVLFVIKWFCFLQKSEISLATQQACGLLHSSGHERPNSIAAMINAREVWFSIKKNPADRNRWQFKLWPETANRL